MDNPRTLTVAAAVMFLNEEQYLPRLLASIERQERVPDLLLLVDDGSDDRSADIAAAFAERHLNTCVLRRPRRERSRDRLAQASELSGFQWAVDQLNQSYDVIAKLDGDLEFPPGFFARIMAAFEADEELGICGGPLSVLVRGKPVPEHSQPWHVRGATKFYRGACLDQISPLPAILGWDSIDETRARMRGWHVRNVHFPEGNTLHLRTTGSYDGAVRGYRRRGVAAWGYGAHPLNVVGSAVLRMRDRPRMVGGLAYLAGWLSAAIRRSPRAEPDVIRFTRDEQLRRMRRVSLRGHAA